MFKIDFLILYEHRERELENACLLKFLLNDQGYSVRIHSIYSFIQHLYDAKVIIVPHLYDDYQVYAFINKYRKRNSKIINLQYEQVLNMLSFELGQGMPKGVAKQSVLFSWGPHEYNRYIEDDTQEAVIVGCLAMDFNCKKYNDYFLSVASIKQQYNIPQGKKILLFISSFSLAEVDEDYLKLHYPNRYTSMAEFAKISHDSKRIILDWLLKFIDSHNDYVVVYRPHPAEMQDRLLTNIENSNSNFKVIRDYSVRQWIRIADFVTTWFSTSIVDSYYAEKNCIIMRPIDIPKNLDVPFMIGAKKVCDYNQFINSFNANDQEFPISEDEIKMFYSNNIGEECSSKIVEFCKEIYESEGGKYCIKGFKKTKENIIKVLRHIIRDCMYDIGKYVDITKVFSFIYSTNNPRLMESIKVERELYDVNYYEKEFLRRLKKIHGKKS